MALPKLPSLLEIYEDPSLLLQLPPHIAAEMAEQLKDAISKVVGADSKIEPDPLSMALALPRYGWMDTRHIHYLSETVADAVENHESVIYTMPPRHCKSTVLSQWTPAWFLRRRPEDHVMLISYEKGVARKWGIKVRGLIEIFGPSWGLALNPKKVAGEDWELIDGGGMRCVGAGGGISGNPAKLLIVDDPIKNDEEARSEIQRESLWEWWDGTVQQRIEPDTTVIVIATRYHEDDLIGRLIAHSEDGTGLPFRVITLPAKALDDDPIGREPGEGLWLDHPVAGGTWGQSYYDKRQAAVSAYTWSAIYQQQPSPPGGNMVDPEWWRFYRPTELPTLEQELQSWDLALDSQNSSDSYMCGGVGGRFGASVYIRDTFHQHCQAPDVINQILAWQAIFPGAKQKLVERSLAGPWLTQTLHHKVGGLLAWPPKGRQKGSKEALLNACVPYIRSGNVYLPLNADGSKPRWVEEFIEELRQFPRAPHDDYVDMFTQLMSFLMPGIERAIDSAHQEAKDGMPAESPQQAYTTGLHALLKRMAAPKLRIMKEQQRQQDRSPIPFGRIRTGLLARARRGFGRGMY